jgi:hypothetical protein
MDQLGKVQKVFIDSIAEATSCLGINLEPNPDPKWNLQHYPHRIRKKRKPGTSGPRQYQVQPPHKQSQFNSHWEKKWLLHQVQQSGGAQHIASRLDHFLISENIMLQGPLIEDDISPRLPGSLPHLVGPSRNRAWHPYVQIPVAPKKLQENTSRLEQEYFW